MEKNFGEVNCVRYLSTWPVYFFIYSSFGLRKSNTGSESTTLGEEDEEDDAEVEEEGDDEDGDDDEDFDFNEESSLLIFPNRSFSEDKSEAKFTR